MELEFSKHEDNDGFQTVSENINRIWENFYWRSTIKISKKKVCSQ